VVRRMGRAATVVTIGELFRERAGVSGMCQAAEAGAQCAAAAMPVKRSKARPRGRGKREKPKAPSGPASPEQR